MVRVLYTMKMGKCYKLELFGFVLGWRPSFSRISQYNSYPYKTSSLVSRQGDKLPTRMQCERYEAQKGEPPLYIRGLENSDKVEGGIWVLKENILVR